MMWSVLGQWRALRDERWAWIAAGLILLLSQIGFWAEAVLDSSFDPTDPARVFAGYVSGLSDIVDVIAVAAMGLVHKDGSRHERPAQVLAARLVVVVAALAAIPVVALVAALPAVAAAAAVWPWADIAGPSPEPWMPSPELLARTLWTAVPFAVLGALLTALTKSRVIGSALAAAYALLEYVLVDLTLGRFESLDWVDGLLASQMRRHWLNNPDTTVGSVPSFAGLSDDIQAPIVLGVHAVWLAAAACLFASRARRQAASEHLPPRSHPRRDALAAPVPEPSDPGRTARPGRLAALVTAAVAAVVAVPAAAGIAALAAARAPTPSETADVYLEYHFAQVLGDVVHVIMAGHPLEEEAAREALRSSRYRRSYSCTDPTNWTPRDNPAVTHCLISVAVDRPVEIFITSKVDITVDTNSDARWPKSTVTGVRVLPNHTRATGPDASTTSVR